MSARRRRNKGPRQPAAPQASSRRRGSKKKPQVGFWGDASKLPPAVSDVRITPEPAVVPHSLGPPPLPGHEGIAEHYFTAIYDRAVTLSGALAAAAGLIQPEELVENLGE
ncbi:MAG TPA: hypothetical protein VMM13_09375 [Euzebya sp.]|nr:hypothetical protein [Euzebya sp.]